MALKKPLCNYAGDVKELQSGDSLPVPSAITVAGETSGTTCYISIFTDETGNLQPKTNAGLTFNCSNGFFGVGGAATEKFEVFGAGTTRFQITETGSTVKVQLKVATTSGFVGTATNHPFRLQTNNVNVVTISTSGSVAISNDAAPNESAILDLISTTKAFLPPRMTTTQRDAIATPTEGMVIMNVTTHVLNFYNGTGWGAV